MFPLAYRRQDGLGTFVFRDVGHRLPSIMSVAPRCSFYPTFLIQMDQQPYPGPSLLFHIRTNVMLGILLTIDVLMLDFAIESVLTHGVGGIVLFGSEYAILLASLLNSALKYYIMLYDLRRARSRGGEDAPVWENKSMYMFYIELVTGNFCFSLPTSRGNLRGFEPYN